MKPWTPILLVALGGALGAAARYAAGVAIGRRLGADFPHGTLFINVTGCFLIALFYSAAAARGGLPEALRYFVPIGFVGGYTTFSSYQWEIARLVQQGQAGRAGLYFVLSNALGYAAIVAGSFVGGKT